MARATRTQLPSVTAAPSPLTRMTYEQFLEWADEDTFAEWVDGEVIWMSPVSDEHQDLAGLLLVLMRLFVQNYQLGVIRHEPFQMKTGPDLPSRSPDILFVANENRSRIQPDHLEGPADLAVEIVSPKSRSRDRKKVREYERGGVREYWLLDQPRRQAEFHELGPDGRYRRMAVGEDGVFRSGVLPGFWLKVEWLWREPLPSEWNILREWGLV